ncbi:MAG: hypothetical protein H6737_12360 [Alphaproteobacteria bacterium]|nr:hypothetical protein [Alphaproteobacteria bacterium]
MEYGDDPKWEHVHPVVGHLLRQHALEPVGLRGFAELPQLDMLGSGRVAVWLAEQARPYVSEERLGDFDAELDAARELLTLETEALLLGRDPEPEASIRVLRARAVARKRAGEVAARRRPAGVDALGIAAAGALTAASYSVMQILQAMAGRLGKTVAPDAVPGLAAALEEAVLVAECQSAADAYITPAVRVTRVLWRGPRGTKPAGHFLFATQGGFAVVTKLKRRWAGMAGDRDEVLATLPDAWFPEAVAQFFGDGAATP